MTKKSDASNVISLSAFREWKRWKSFVSIVNRNALSLETNLARVKERMYLKQLKPTNPLGDAD